MKRIRFAVIFLVIAAAACAFEQWYIKDFCTEMKTEAGKAIACLNKSDETGFKQSADRIKTVWNKRNDLLFCVSGHNQLNELSVKINGLDGKKENIYDIAALINAIYENNVIKSSNIL